MANKYVSYGFDDYEWESNELRLAWMITALGDWSDHDGVSFPSIKRLALRCKVSERQCTAMTKTLEDRGDILIVRPARQGRGQHNHYLITDDKTQSEIAEVIRRHPRFNHLNPEETAKAVIEKRRAYGRKVRVEDVTEEKPDDKERLTPDNFTPDVEIKLLTAWGKVDVPNGFDAAMLSEIQTAIERSTWRVTEDEKRLACYLVHVTNWPLPTDAQGRKAWKAGFKQHREMVHASLETIGRLYAASFAQMRLYQKRAAEDGKPFTITPVPQSLTKTMRGKWAEWQEREREEKDKLFSGTTPDPWAAFRPESS